MSSRDSVPSSANVPSETTILSATMAGGAFNFVTDLAQEISAGRVELPSFPEVAMRVRRTLTDEDVSSDTIARVVGSEAALAGRVLTLANSAAFSRGGRPITDLKAAVSRVGHNNIRTAAVSFAIAQLRSAAELKNIAKELEQVWQEATAVAALAYVLAQRTRTANADEAMLAGLLHNVGKLYLLARANRHGSLFKDPIALAQIMRDWHANVGKAIVENWGFPERIVAAIGEHESIERVVEKPDLTDVLTSAVFMASFLGCEADLELNMQGVKAFWRLQLDNTKAVAIMQESSDEITAMRQALGD
jgi:putative nucleotidyltransferase with HDIG domain